MSQDENFYTLKGYSLIEHAEITASMEDYLEMICRFHQTGQTIRIKDIAKYLHVKPSSASKMVNNLKTGGFVSFEKYGRISLTEKGLELGQYLLMRHEILHQFFCYVNHSQNELEQVEKVEHFIDPRTVLHLKELLEQTTHVVMLHVEPTHAEPTHVESLPVDPAHVDPLHVDPAHVEPAHVEPPHVDPLHVEPLHVEPTHVEPLPVDPTPVI